MFANLLHKTGEIVCVCLDTGPKSASRRTAETTLVVGVAGDILAAQVCSGCAEKVAVIVETMQGDYDRLYRVILRQPGAHGQHRPVAGHKVPVLNTRFDDLLAGVIYRRQAGG